MRYHVEEQRKTRWVHIASFEAEEYAIWFTENANLKTPLRVVEMWPRRRIVRECNRRIPCSPSK